MKMVKENISVGTSIQLIFQRSQQTLDSIFKEFIDNSSQSFLDNRDELLSVGIDKCIVTIDILEDEIIITDNAYGMNREQFRRALRLNARPEQIKGSRNQFGMGLKYSAISLGDEYTIETTSLGNNEKYKTTITKELLEEDISEVDNQISEEDVNNHYTKITIKRLSKEINEATLNILMDQLATIYQTNIKNKDLQIIFSPDRVVEYIDPPLELDENGSEYWRDFSETFEFNDKFYTIHGWIGILLVGSVSGAGFSLEKDNRIIELNYRPKYLFGNANSFPYQRITGNITVNDFPDNYNKSSFDWSGGLEAKFLSVLKENKIISDMINVSKKLRKNVKKVYKPPLKYSSEVNKDIEKLFKPLKEVTKTVLNEDIKVGNSPVYLLNMADGIIPTIIEFEGVKYKFYIKHVEDQEDWFDIKDFNNNSEYLITINNNFSLFDGLNKASSAIIQKLVILLVTAELSTSRTSVGVNNSIMRRKINKILQAINKDE